MGEPREQEQSIKDRKKLIYDDDPTPDSAIGKPFALFLRETPAAPVPGVMKAGLWFAAILVLLLLAAAAWKASQPKGKPEAEKKGTMERSRSMAGRAA